MTSSLQLTSVTNPAAQTFRITNPSGAVLTSVGLFFATKPTTNSIPVTIELRPVADGGTPSSVFLFSNTIVSKTPAEISASTSFDGSSNETKFTFAEPLYVPGNTEIALVIHTNAPPGDYKLWIAKLGEFYTGSTTKKITTQLASGSFFASSNGTTWTPEQTKDMTFKIYRADFNYTNTLANLYPTIPPARRLSPTRIYNSPLLFNAGSSEVRVVHPFHGFQVSDKVYLSTDSAGFDSASVINGVLGSSILGQRTITKTDPFGYVVAMDSAADSSVRAGGNSVFATEQYVLDEVRLILPAITPEKTSMQSWGKFTTSKSFAGSETAYQSSNTFTLNPGRVYNFKDPHVITSSLTETNSLSGGKSTTVYVNLNTVDRYVAPHINLTNAALQAGSVFIDYQADSATAILRSDRNTSVIVPYVSETDPSSGTVAAKHIAKPISLLDKATSLKVLIDANRPAAADFSVWYRTGLVDDVENPLSKKTWTEFSKTITIPNRSNYNDTPADDDFLIFREYYFETFDLPAFNHYQIKIVMNSTKSSRYPRFKNLRTVATK